MNEQNEAKKASANYADLILKQDWGLSWERSTGRARMWKENETARAKIIAADIRQTESERSARNLLLNETRRFKEIQQGKGKKSTERSVGVLQVSQEKETRERLSLNQDEFSAMLVHYTKTSWMASIFFETVHECTEHHRHGKDGVQNWKARHGCPCLSQRSHQTKKSAS